MARRDFREDERGQMLILAGVILVLGFVIVGSTLIQLQNVGEETARLERESLVDEFVTLLETFNETLGDVTDVGNTNVDDFRGRLEGIEQNVRELTTKRGLVLEAEPDGTPQAEADADVARPSRCANRVDNDGGVITGVDMASQRASIVGVVYRVWITDGQETIEDVVYFRFYQCVIQTLYTPLDTFLDAQSLLATEPPAGFPDGVRYPGAAPDATFTEAGQYGGSAATYDFAADAVVSDTDWSQEGRITLADNQFTTTDDTPAGNALLIDFADTGFSGATLLSVKVAISGKVDALAVGDTFELVPVLDSTPGTPIIVVPLAAETSMVANITAAKPTPGPWTVADLDNLRLQIRGVSNGIPPSGLWYLDNATLTVRAKTLQIFNGDAVLQRTGLPDYDRHWLVFNATTVPAPGEEEVRFQVYNWSLNGGAGDWEAWNVATGGNGVLGAAPASVMLRLREGFQISGSDIVRVRFLFNTPDDAVASSLVVDELRVKSVLDS